MDTLFVIFLVGVALMLIGRWFTSVGKRLQKYGEEDERSPTTTLDEGP